MMLLLSRMDLFLKKCSSAETFRQEIMPLLYTALELPVPHVQEQALKAVNAVLEKLEFSSIKSVLLLKIQSLYTTSQVLSIRINALIAVHSMIKTLDKVRKAIFLWKFNRLTPNLVYVNGEDFANAEA